jgi:ligand-binding sensor domain-containing protein
MRDIKFLRRDVCLVDNAPVFSYVDPAAMLNLTRFSSMGKAIIAIVLIMAFSGPCAAGAGDYLIETWDTSSGLPDSTVHTIAQTPDGYLWIGTENGLARFDGIRFENFVRENTPVLLNPSVDFLQVDSQGTLWIGAGDHVLTWDGRRFNEQMWAWSATDWVSSLLISRTNEIIFVTGEGRLVQGSLMGQGVYQWRSSPAAGPSMFAADAQGEIWRLTKGGLLWRIDASQPKLVVIPAGAGQINKLTADARGGIWLGTEHQLLRLVGGRFCAVPPPAGETDFSVTEIYPMKDGSLWMVGNGSLWKFQDNGWVARAGAWPARFPELRKYIDDREGNAWFGHFGVGLVRLSENGRLQILNAHDGLPSDHVRCLFQDREGNLWAGFDRGGLVRLRKKQFQVLGTADGLSDPVVLGVCEDAAGAIWAGTFGGGLNRWVGGKFTSFNLGQDGSPGYIFSVFPDHAGRLWVSTRENGVFIRENGAFRHPFSTTAIQQPVRAFFEDRGGIIWIGSGAGIFRWRDEKLESFAADTEIGQADVRAIAQDANGAIWIGTHGSGLHRFQAGQHTAFHMTNGLPNEFVRSLYADPDGTLWIGLYGGGLFCWQDGRLLRAAPAKDLPDDVICYFEDDGRGRLWISTHHGLFRVAKADLHAFADGRAKKVPCIAYGKSDGLPALEFSGGIQPAGWRGHDGRLWFGTDDGLISFQPAATTVNPLPPPVVVESLVVDGELLAASTDTGGTVKDVRRDLRIPAGRTQFEFHFTGLSFIAPDKVRFQYRLEGLQRDWMDAGMNRSVAYDYLPPGKYIFHVRAENNDGVWNEDGAAVTFELLPHFWQRWWFRVMIFVLSIGLVWLAYYLRMARLRELEQLRLRIARDLHDDVGANLASLALIAEAMEKQPTFGDPADLRRIALHTIDSLRDIVWFIDPARDNLGDMVLRMRDTAPTLLTGVKFDFQAKIPNPSIHLPPAFRRHIFPIFKEALHNAARHAQASRVDIELDCREGGLLLKIQDDGKGFAEKNITPGNGLRNLRRRAAEMRGAVLIHSIPGRGTTLEFYAPFPQTRGFGFGASWLYLKTRARQPNNSVREKPRTQS